MMGFNRNLRVATQVGGEKGMGSKYWQWPGVERPSVYLERFRNWYGDKKRVDRVDFTLGVLVTVVSFSSLLPDGGLLPQIDGRGTFVSFANDYLLRGLALSGLLFGVSVMVRSAKRICHGETTFLTDVVCVVLSLIGAVGMFAFTILLAFCSLWLSWSIEASDWVGITVIAATFALYATQLDLVREAWHL